MEDMNYIGGVCFEQTKTHRKKAFPDSTQAEAKGEYSLVFCGYRLRLLAQCDLCSPIDIQTRCCFARIAKEVSPLKRVLMGRPLRSLRLLWCKPPRAAGCVDWAEEIQKRGASKADSAAEVFYKKKTLFEYFSYPRRTVECGKKGVSGEKIVSEFLLWLPGVEKTEDFLVVQGLDRITWHVPHPKEGTVPLGTLRMKSKICSFFVCDDTVCAGLENGFVFLWGFMQPFFLGVEIEGAASALDVHRNGDFLFVFCGTKKGVLFLTVFQEAEIVHQEKLFHLPSAVRSVEFFQTPSFHVIVGTEDGGMSKVSLGGRAWCLESGVSEYAGFFVFSRHSKSGRYLFCGTVENSLMIISTEKMQVLGNVTENISSVTDGVCVSEEDSRCVFISCSLDGSIVQWAFSFDEENGFSYHVCTRVFFDAVSHRVHAQPLQYIALENGRLYLGDCFGQLSVLGV
ncbi:MAG: uncharacterized protein A8A55_0038 [Amphiamblys sp. WSBS2006]|nr:MAG: uncharacterized protein A8A55_0038 [Amphiamblys sp. WSBS2006]